MSENNTQKQQPMQDMGELLRIRREKLAELQSEGANPFDITTYDQEYHTSDITENFDEMDTNHDGRVTSAEISAFCHSLICVTETEEYSFMWRATSWAKNRTRSLKNLI